MRGTAASASSAAASRRVCITSLFGIDTGRSGCEANARAVAFGHSCLFFADVENKKSKVFAFSFAVIFKFYGTMSARFS